jgi:hypothetical protein
MKKVVFLFSLLFSNYTSFSQVVINEIMVNPAGTNDGTQNPVGSTNTSEWLELYNTGATAVDLSCWKLTDGDFTIVIPSGYSIAPFSHFTVANFAGSGLTPNLDWGTCGCALGSNAQLVVFTNTAEQLGLFDASAVLQDAVIWGNTAATAGQGLPDASVPTGTVGSCVPQALSLPIATDPAYEYIGITGATANNGVSSKRDADGSNTWVNTSIANSFGTNNNGLLPIILTNFTATPTNNQVQLSWATATEFNSDYFKINKSTDGEHYTAIGTVKSNNSNTGASYTFYDNSPTLGNSYYTLTSTDFDGSESVSNVVAMQYLGTQKTHSFYTYNHTLQIQALSETILTHVNIYSPMGQLLKTIAINSNALLTIDLSQLAKGMYYAQINAQNSTYTERFVVE